MRPQEITLVIDIAGSCALAACAWILRIGFLRIWYVILGWPLLILLCGIMAIYHVMVRVAKE